MVITRSKGFHHVAVPLPKSSGYRGDLRIRSDRHGQFLSVRLGSSNSFQISILILVGKRIREIPGRWYLRMPPSQCKATAPEQTEPPHRSHSRNLTPSASIRKSFLLSATIVELRGPLHLPKSILAISTVSPPSYFASPWPTCWFTPVPSGRHMRGAQPCSPSLESSSPTA
jgi:hypothetical protein